MPRSKILVLQLLAVIVTVSSIYLLAPWRAGILYLSPLPSTVQEQLDSAVAKNIDGIIVFYHKLGEAPKTLVSGWHDRSQQIKAKPDALFKIASIGKLYDASAIAKLVANGSLSLDGTLAQYLPSLALRIENADEITIRMLVEHRSGIPNYTDQPGFNWGETSVGADDNLNLVLDLPADFKPNADYGYSNTNYLLLSIIMKKVLGYDHSTFIKEAILDPLNLKNTHFSVNDIDLNDLMSGYHIDYDYDFKGLDQGFVATAEDVGVFLRALNDGSLFTEKEQEIYQSIYEYEHTGWVLGYYSIARYHKDIDTVVIQFVNTVGGNTLTFNDVMYHRIVKILSQPTEKN
ncbi:serine hydrolase domain-containing protein [Thalassotalea eurytherma]|uniref:Beta-lactamase-related domain-containing protein n=1 Tax=Thalassotalea eurytherma TaxID=1144278 RepID=A0ABQ6GYK1_9GAMM|nr:serine hydrolase domain-containing protein [Thalassotalea eurytherma]GLX80985.1 hypothetical protein theurythT_04370 [Thalassotalea eurytherma]